jgi:hypothetical protein
MLEVAEADLEPGFVRPQGVPQIGRRARRRERSGVPGFTMAARVRRTHPMHRPHRGGGPRVRILLPPAESLSPAGLYLRGSRTPAFRAGFEAAFSARSAESRRAANIAPTRSSISVGLYSSTAFPAMRSRQVVGLKSPGGSPNEIGLLGSRMLVDLESSDRAQAKPSAAR